MADGEWESIPGRSRGARSAKVDGPWEMRGVSGAAAWADPPDAARGRSDIAGLPSGMRVRDSAGWGSGCYGQAPYPRAREWGR